MTENRAVILTVSVTLRNTYNMKVGRTQFTVDHLVSMSHLQAWF